MADIAVVIRDTGSGLSLDIIDEGNFDPALHIRYPMIARRTGQDSMVLIDEIDFKGPEYDLSGVFRSYATAAEYGSRALARQA